MSALFNAIDSNWIAFAEAVALGGAVFGLIMWALMLWEEMHR